MDTTSFFNVMNVEAIDLHRNYMDEVVTTVLFDV